MTTRDWEAVIRADLDRRREEHRYREARVVVPVDATHVEVAGRTVINFASNSYLGLSFHPAVVAAMHAEIDKSGVGSGAAPLITGHTRAHANAQRAVAAWKGTESALLLNSGYQANLAAVQTLAILGGKAFHRAAEPVRFLLDKLCHASLIDAVRDRYPFRVFAHNDLRKLRRLLDDAPEEQAQVVVTESIFSMDGDAADLRGLWDLKQVRPYLLLLDEAHASGVYGTRGSGLANEAGLHQLADVTVVTLSKAAGCSGGAVCASNGFCQLLANYAAAYIYSTSVPASIAAAAEAAIGVMGSEPSRQQRVRAAARRLRSDLTDAGIDVPGGDSPIVPVLLGEEQTALTAADRLLKRGLLILPIRPPTVARGTSRLRITLSSEHTDLQINALIDGLVDSIR